jgi:tetratricopeptide (TPR) repeat protein
MVLSPIPQVAAARQRARGAALLLLVALVGACGARRVATDRTTEPVEVIEFDPMLIQASTDDDGAISTVAIDLPALFAEAGDYLAADDFENAARLYRILISAWDDAPVDTRNREAYLRASVCNLGLALEAMGEWDAAARAYRRVINEWRASDDATWAYYRLAETLSLLGDWEAIPPLMATVADRSGQPLRSRLEGVLRWANALLETRDYAGAEMRFRQVIDMNQRAARQWSADEPDFRNEPLDRVHPIVSQAYFGLGRVYHELFLEIRIVLPEEAMTRALIDKGQLFEQAQVAYLDCVRAGNRYWAPAAGFMTGQLYEDMYYDVLASEIPTTFNELELEVYFEELRAFLEPALRRASAIYENNLAMAYRLGSDGVWVDDTLERLNVLQRYLHEKEGWEAEQRLIVEQQHPRSARFGDQLIFRSDREGPPSAR